MRLASEFARKKAGSLKPNINVTPLVDVVLVLLIIFMVVLPSVQDGKPIEMIRVANADEPDKNGTEPLVVTINSAQVFTLGESDMSREQVLSELRSAFARSSGQQVLLRADARLEYACVRDLFHEVQQIGFKGIALAVGASREWSQEEGG